MNICPSLKMQAIGIFLALVSLTILLPLQAKAQSEKPNFIIIFTDDQGYGDLGTYGNPTIKTPEY